MTICVAFHQTQVMLMIEIQYICEDLKILRANIHEQYFRGLYFGTKIKSMRNSKGMEFAFNVDYDIDKIMC